VMSRPDETTVLLGSSGERKPSASFVQRNAHPIVAALSVACIGMVFALVAGPSAAVPSAVTPEAAVFARDHILAQHPNLYLGSHSFPKAESGASQTFSRYTWNVTGVRSVHPAGQRKPKGRPEQAFFMEVAEMYFYDTEGVQVIPSVVAAGPGSQYVPAKSPTNIIDGDIQTVYINEGHFDLHYSLVDFYFDPPVAIEEVYFVSGKQWASRDPMSWTWTGTNSVAQSLGEVVDHVYDAPRREKVAMPPLVLPDQPPFAAIEKPPCSKPIASNTYSMRFFSAKSGDAIEIGAIEFVDKTYYAFDLNPADPYPLSLGINETVRFTSPNQVRVWHFRVKTSSSDSSKDPVMGELIREPVQPNEYMDTPGFAVETVVESVKDFMLPETRDTWSEWIEVCGA